MKVCTTVFVVVLVLLVLGYTNGEGMYHSYRKTDITNQIHICCGTVFVLKSICITVVFTLIKINI